MRLDGLLKESKDIRAKIMDQEKYINNFKDDILECLHKIVDYKKLKKIVAGFYQRDRNNQEAFENEFKIIRQDGSR